MLEAFARFPIRRDNLTARSAWRTVIRPTAETIPEITVGAFPLMSQLWVPQGLDFETWDPPIVIDKITRSQTYRWEMVKSAGKHSRFGKCCEPLIR